ncbi:hypothetical protein J4455_00810 [Candidatus Woesearchaeota archaeon]|nr:hypothetical protein [Candidatus Woesearchaeota archaeon]
MKQKGDIWISAVLYMALGIIILVIVLSVAIPVVNKIRDKNIALNTKELMFDLDRNIRIVYSEGPGSRRPIKLEITKGTFSIDQAQDTISWQFSSKVQLSQLNLAVKEGSLIINTTQGASTKDFLTTYTLNYTSILDITSTAATNFISGKTNLIISNTGNNKILIDVY